MKPTDKFFIEISQEINDPDAEDTIQVETTRQCLEMLRDGAITQRNKALGSEFNPEVAVGLTHIAALIRNALDEMDQQKLNATLSR